MRLAIYGSRQHQAYGPSIGRFLDLMAEGGAEIVMHRKIYDVLARLMPLRLRAVRQVVDGPSFSADAVLSIGGDGTFLRTAQWVGDKQIPILGINAGHLGYLSGASVEELPELVPYLLAGDFNVEDRSMIEVVSPRLPIWPYALNEAAVSKEENASMIVADTRVNGASLAAYRADGLLVSTPTGSTAYNLSVGGPILQPSAPVWVITPIAAHSLGMRPLVVADSSEVSITVQGRARAFRVTLDGRAASMPIGTEVRLRKAPFAVKLITLPDHTFVDALREKLHWNE